MSSSPETPIRAALAEGTASLPTLTREELAAIGAMETCPLRDARELDWWAKVPEEAREPVRTAALRGLVARGLVSLENPEVAEGDMVALNASGELVVILAARSQPAFLVVGGEPAIERRACLRMYGVIDDDYQAFLIEHVETSGLHRFVLASVDRAADELAGWAAQTDLPMPRTVEVIWPSEQGPLGARLAVVAAEDGIALADGDDEGRLAEPAIVSRDELRQRLGALISPLQE